MLSLFFFQLIRDIGKNKIRSALTASLCYCLGNALGLASWGVCVRGTGAMTTALGG